MTVSLAYLVSAVRNELDDTGGLFDDSILEQFIAEGQRKMEPEILLDKTYAISWADAATGVTLPADLYSIIAIDPDSTSMQVPVRYRYLGSNPPQLVFDKRDTVYAFTGTLFYRAHYPDVTSTAPCQIPAAAVDGLIHYALYLGFNKLAANRSLYKRFATLATNGVSVADLQAIAQNHLADFNDVKAAVQRLPEPQTFYNDR